MGKVTKGVMHGPLLESSWRIVLAELEKWHGAIPTVMLDGERYYIFIERTNDRRDIVRDD